MNDINYMGMKIPLNDEKTWQFICKAKNLKGLFQLETESAARVLQQIKPICIDDLSVCNALNRPGSLKFTQEIALVREGKKAASYLHPALEPLLKNSFGTLIYQESLLLIAQKLANFKAKDSATLLKAIGKKDKDKLKGLKESFRAGILANNLPEELAEKLFSWFLDFADYSFNKCLHPSTIVESTNGQITLENLKVGDKVRAYNPTNKTDHYVIVKDKFFSKQTLYEIKMEDGHKIQCSMKHKFLCACGQMHTLGWIYINKLAIVTDSSTVQAQKIKSIKSLGVQDSIDIEVGCSDHNFYANGFVSSNSHSISYSISGYICAYTKLHHPLQFFSSLLNYTQYEQKPIEEVAECVAELEDFGIKILPPSIDKLSNKFDIEDGSIRYPIGLLKALGESLFAKLKTLTPTQTSTLDRCLEAMLGIGLNSRSIESIIVSGAMDKFEQDRELILFYYWFLSELQPEVLEKFWAYKNGNLFSKRLVFKFLTHRQEIAGKTKQLEMFNEGKINKNIKYKSFFKTETTRLKTLEKTREYLKTVATYRKNKPLARFFWETYVLGFSYNYRFSKNIRTYRDIEQGEDTFKPTCGVVEEVKFRTSAKGNDYAVISVRFDKKLELMVFGEVCDGIKGILRKDDLVKIQVSGLQNKLKVESINVINKEREKYEFYKKQENKQNESAK